ncbi:tetraspanin-15-like [Nothobranchius furzeri]|uniref:Tetraspanin-15-like n=1 Tax=Nothobranchius furzeri TaxID=105023 RepID=A0A9D3BB11_NOTFU|nr:tetraspanin-15-like [Nothobranchius furzeri]
MPSYSDVRKTNHFYYFIKFTLNIYSMVFSLMGLCVLCVGVYAEVERQKNRTLEGIFLAPAVVLILLGLVMFTVSVVGMVGSLRDNKTLLHMFLCVLCVLLLLQTVALTAALIFEKKTSTLFQSTIREGIKHYYDDLDFKNILDYVQQKVVSFASNALLHRTTVLILNTWLKLSSGFFLCSVHQRETLHDDIYVRGCIHAVNLWMSDNIGITVAVCCAIGLPQLLGIILSCVFWNLLVDMSESADMVDFKLKKSEFDYSDLDLAGAGWCLCLPRDGGYLPVPESEPERDPIDVHLEKLKKQPPRTHSQLRELQQSRSASGLDEVDAGRKQKREH